MENIQQEQAEKIETWFLNIDKLGRPSKLRKFRNRVSQILIECKTRTSQNHGRLVEYDSNGKIVTVCAMGLLALDQGLLSYGNDVSDLGKVFDSLGYNNNIGHSHSCKVKGCDMATSTWSDYIVHLNDQHAKSFNQIGSIFNQIYLRKAKK
jgi:hypothetical protein